MKLVDILARELKVWPEQYYQIYQDTTGCLHGTLSDGDAEDCCQEDLPFEPVPIAWDGISSFVSRSEWQAAVDALAAQSSEAAKDMHDTAVNAQDRDRYSTENVSIVFNYATLTDSPKDAHCMVVNPNKFNTYKANFREGFQPSCVDPRTIVAGIVDPDSQWNGEGLPPVGARVESGSRRSIGLAGSISEHDLRWSEAVVIAHGVADGTRFAIAQGENEIHVGQAEDFRPIRTPEQIAAEAVKEEIEEMADIMRKYAFGTDAQAYAEAAYKFGYRKP